MRPSFLFSPSGRLAARIIGLGGIALIACGCSPRLIPPEVLREVDPKLSLEEVRKDVDAQRGKRILLGGEIIEVHPAGAGTELEILEKPLNPAHYPMPIDDSEGRFILVYHGALDPALFKSGRRVTVVGKVSGSRAFPDGAPVPVLEERFLHLWPPGGRDPSEPTFSFGLGFGAVFGR